MASDTGAEGVKPAPAANTAEQASSTDSQKAARAGRGAPCALPRPAKGAASFSGRFPGPLRLRIFGHLMMGHPCFGSEVLSSIFRFAHTETSPASASGVADHLPFYRQLPRFAGAHPDCRRAFVFMLWAMPPGSPKDGSLLWRPPLLFFSLRPN